VLKCRFVMALYVVLGAIGALVLLSLLLRTTRRLWVFALLAWKHIFLWLGDKLGIRQLIIKMKGKQHRPYTRPVMARRMAEDLGPTFIKFGQIVASSAGMFPKPYVTEFQKCLDRVRPFGYDQVMRTIREDLGDKASRLVLVDEKPLASASIAQVHTAELDDGSKVVVKVQRPGIPRRIDADMRILRGLARTAERFVRDAELANPVGVVEDFAETLREELDFRKEAANCERFNEIMTALAHADVHAPRPYWDLTSPRVLTMQRFYGIRVDDKAAVEARGVDAEAKLIKGLRAWFQCVLLYGFFHGDVHAGNLMLLDDGHLGFLDFGIVGRFNQRQKEMVTDYIVAFATGDYKSLGKTIIEMGGVDPSKIDMAVFVADLDQAYSPLRRLNFADINYAELLPSIHRVASKHRMKMPKEFVLITKQMLYFDRYAKLLAPKLNIFTDPRLIISLQEDVMRARRMNAESTV
jgi:predicted unusual protein kinase regulating ubiquinone biosynthesis (AarF/ABC1/UbiB family)